MASGSEGFRRASRDWLGTHFPRALAGLGPRYMSSETPPEPTPAFLAWKRAIAEKGWGVPTWPCQYGGAGLSEEEAAILAEEMAAAGAWTPIGGMGVMMFGPTLLEYGTEQQKLRHLPGIADGSIRWCQGYSEPGAGSDLASLQCRAEDKGDHFLVNGQKVWTSGAQWSDWCFALVRTDPSDKRGGISFLMIDMRSPGVTVKPIRMISGSSPFCETFFDNVEVPKDNLLGATGQGWTIGKRLLQHERGGISQMSSDVPPLHALALTHLAISDDGRLADGELRVRIARCEMEALALALTVARIQSESEEGGPPQATSILKNVGAWLAQERAELMLEILGTRGLGWEGAGFAAPELEACRQWLFSKAVSIYGGTTEIQNDIVAKRMLGLKDA
ncbi:acyl-CoA dehydrogenase family protein [Sphingomonas immobilis]|uniref:Acyl-CoA dehydrogenase family protein n=1 Tax=Sphingomonas immobilis TaxID=3063997 RepID=A0ABT9A2I5_9SPHN|nr:acyl-CoA dehydrogenase family protein [Sphingomonas sp. CA1-15]MDO7844050.1 acyl-CoA dehydrogenase family protein [Sphingomonas sp. CA1-15]